MDGLPAGFLRNLRWQYIATFGAAALGGLYLLVVGRALGVENFGLYSLCMAIAGVVFNCSDFRLQEVAIRFLSIESHPDMAPMASSRLRALFLIDVSVRSLAALAIVFVATMAAHTVVHNAMALEPILLSGAVLFFSKTGSGPATGILRVAGKFEWTAWLSILDWGVRLAVTAAFAFTSGLSIALVLVVALLISGAVNLATVVAALWAWHRQAHAVSSTGIELRDRPLWRFIWSCYGISLCDNVVRELDTTIVGLFLNVAAAGIYRMAKNFVNLIWRVADPVFLVVMPEFSRLLGSGHWGKLRVFLRRLIVVLGGSALFLFVATSAVMPWIVRTFLGASFSLVATVYPIMLSFILISMPLIWTHALLAAAGRPDLQLRANILGNVVAVGLLTVLTRSFGIYGAAFGWAVGLSATFALSGFFLWRAGIVR